MREGSRPVASRLRDLSARRDAVKGRREDLIAAVAADFGHRAWQETLGFDILSTVKTIDYLRRNLPGWMRPERRRVALHFRPGAAWVGYEPIGVGGPVSPWNYPIVSALSPLATALAAGNRVMLTQAFGTRPPALPLRWPLCSPGSSRPTPFR
ncbi:hypothetical protein MOTC310_24190 [Methylobacterium oryzae]|uniref:Aldehyde dehydrogenase domain-containing protein n=1 Tax=Methylobacterium oryzae TaxID=334852 RepID=A0ABU7TUC9_9HYPH